MNLPYAAPPYERDNNVDSVGRFDFSCNLIGKGGLTTPVRHQNRVAQGSSRPGNTYGPAYRIHRFYCSKSRNFLADYQVRLRRIRVEIFESGEQRFR